MGRKEADFAHAMHNGTEDLVDKHATYDVYLSVNLSDTNRESDEPTLFVGREPHQVRSLADSGVRYEFDVKTKNLQISLENPAVRPEYEIDSVVPVTSHRLCLSCLDALNYFCRYREEQTKVSHAQMSYLTLSDKPSTKHRLYSAMKSTKIQDFIYQIVSSIMQIYSPFPLEQ